MGNVHIKQMIGVEELDVSINRVKNIDPLKIAEVQNIAPIAHHIKEVNHIDPLNIDAFHVSEVRNIDPISIDKFQITNLPPVNMAVRNIPDLNMNFNKIAPVSVGSHQNFQIPSDYVISGVILGLELFRIYIKGNSNMIPQDRYRKEHELGHNRSFPIVPNAGNPAIPSKTTKIPINTYTACDHGCNKSGHCRPVGLVIK